MASVGVAENGAAVLVTVGPGDSWAHPGKPDTSSPRQPRSRHVTTSRAESIWQPEVPGNGSCKRPSMTPKPLSFRQIDAPSEVTPQVPHGVQIVDTFGFEIIEQASPVPPANVDDARSVSFEHVHVVFEHVHVVPFAATLPRIA